MKGSGKMLRKMGIDPSMMGYNYLKEALAIMSRNPDSIHAVTKEIYPVVAKSYKVTASRVERCMRNAIEKGFDNMPYDEKVEYFGGTLDLESGKVTNSTFIAVVYELLKEENGEV